MLITIAIIVVLALLLFGYKKLPELGRRAGESVNHLAGSAREAIDERLEPAESDNEPSAAGDRLEPTESGTDPSESRNAA